MQKLERFLFALFYLGRNELEHLVWKRLGFDLSGKPQLVYISLESNTDNLAILPTFLVLRRV
jgi:hypothetical protein